MKSYKPPFIIITIIFIGIVLFLQLWQRNMIPPCLNADEAAFGYNAYSIIKTGRDEHGKLLPLRFQSFEDFKMPLYGYLSIPPISIMGLSDASIRIVNIGLVIGCLMVSLSIAKMIHSSLWYRIIVGVLVSSSVWIHILARQAHEAVCATFFLLVGLYFLVRYMKKKNLTLLVAGQCAMLFSAYSYHSARIFVVLFFLISGMYVYRDFIKKGQGIAKQTVLTLIVLTVFVAVPFISDAQYKTTRLSSLVFYKNPGFTMRLAEYRGEHNVVALHNILIESVRDVATRYLSQFSTDFLMVFGDANPRFGFKGIGLVTPVEYLCFFIGLYALFRKRHPLRWLLMGGVMVAPIANALTWQDVSMTRTYFFIFPFLYISAMGLYHIISEMKQHKEIRRTLYLLLITGIVATHLFFLTMNFDMYFFHYPKRALVQRAWQCGYRETVSYIAKNYHRFNTFYITRKHGQPYIFLLYYMSYDPRRFMRESVYSPSDEYGFSQVERFDKYIFSLPQMSETKKIAYIGYPDDFSPDRDGVPDKIIKSGNEEIFWIYER